MTGDKFDELARSLAGKWSKRDTLGLFGGSLAALLTGTRLARAQATPDLIRPLTPAEAANITISPQTQNDLAILAQDLSQRGFQPQSTTGQFWGSFIPNGKLCAALWRFPYMGASLEILIKEGVSFGFSVQYQVLTKVPVVLSQVLNGVVQNFSVGSPSPPQVNQVCQAVCNLVLQSKTNGADCATVVKLIDCLTSTADRPVLLVAAYKALSNQGQICDVIEHGCIACTSPVTCTNPACSGDQVCLDSGGTQLPGMPPPGLQCCSCAGFSPETAKCCVRPNRQEDREKAKQWAGTVYPGCAPTSCVCQWDDNPQSSEYWGNGGAPGCATLAVQCESSLGYICTN